MALVNIGAHIMNVNVVAYGQSVFWRDIVFGGNAFTEAIQRELNLTREQAEAVKTGEQLGDHSPQTVLGILNGVSEDLAAELQKTFEFFFTTSSHDKVEEIVLSGGSSPRSQPRERAQGAAWSAGRDHEPVPRDRILRKPVPARMAEQARTCDGHCGGDGVA